MTVTDGLLKHIIQRCLYPVIIIRRNTTLQGNFIRDFKTHAVDILCQAIRVLAHDFVHTLAVILVDFYRKLVGNTVFLKKNHCLTHFSLFFKLPVDFSCDTFADAFNFHQTLRFFLYDSEGVFLKFFYDTGCQRLSYAFDGTGGKVAFHRLSVLRLYCLVRYYF